MGVRAKGRPAGAAYCENMQSGRLKGVHGPQYMLPNILLLEVNKPAGCAERRAC